MQSLGTLESVSNLCVEHFNANNVFLEANKIWSIFERSLDGYSFYRYNIYMCALYNRALELGLHNVGKISIQEVKKNWLQYYIEFKEDLFEQLLYGKLQYSIKIIDCLPQDFLKEVKEMDIKKRPSKSSLLVLKITKNTDNNAPNVLSAKVSHTPDIKIQQILGLSIYKLSEKEVNIYANHSWNILETTDRDEYKNYYLYYIKFLFKLYRRSKALGLNNLGNKSIDETWSFFSHYEDPFCLNMPSRSVMYLDTHFYNIIT